MRPLHAVRAGSAWLGLTIASLRRNVCHELRLEFEIQPGQVPRCGSRRSPPAWHARGAVGPSGGTDRIPVRCPPASARRCTTGVQSGQAARGRPGSSRRATSGPRHRVSKCSSRWTFAHSTESEFWIARCRRAFPQVVRPLEGSGSRARLALQLDHEPLVGSQLEDRRVDPGAGTVRVGRVQHPSGPESQLQAPVFGGQVERDEHHRVGVVDVGDLRKQNVPEGEASMVRWTPSASAGCSRRNRIRRWVMDSSDAGSSRCAATLRRSCPGARGNHGSTSGAQNPPFAVPSHGIGERPGSRPCVGSTSPHGSRTWSGRSSVSGSPSSSP